MKFEVKRINKNISDAELLDDVKSVVRINSLVSITIEQYEQLGSYCSTTLKRRFGGWNKVLALIGLVPNNQFYTNKQLYHNIERVWLFKGKQPVRRDMDDNSISEISSYPYLRNFGSWYNALDAFVEYINSDDAQTEDELNTLEEVAVIIQNTHKTRRNPSDRLKVMVLMRDGNSCRLCGTKCNDGLHNIHFDHISPWSKGGETTLENLQVLCSVCNEAKGNYYPENDPTPETIQD